jgi:phage portal protein BeeE
MVLAIILYNPHSYNLHSAHPLSAWKNLKIGALLLNFIESVQFLLTEIAVSTVGMNTAARNKTQKKSYN